MPDLDSIVEDAMIAGQAERAAAAPATPAPDSPTPEKIETETPAATDGDGSPAPATDEPAQPDNGAPQPTEPEKTPEPTPTVSALDEAYAIAGIDPKDPQAPAKLTEHLKAAKAVPAKVAEPEPKPEEQASVVRTAVTEFINTDAECQTLAADYRQHDETLKALKAESETINRTIAALDLRLNPPKVDGVEDPELNEFQQADLQRKLDKAWRDHDSIKRRAETAVAKRQTSIAKWKDRVEKHTESLISKQDEEKKARDDKAELDKGAHKERVAFESAFDVEFKASGLPAEVKSRIKENVTLRAAAQIDKWQRAGKLDFIEDPRAFIAEQLKGEIKAYEEHHVLKSRDYANDKRTAAKHEAPDAPASKQHQPGGDKPKALYADKFEALDDIMESARGR